MTLTDSLLLRRHPLRMRLFAWAVVGIVTVGVLAVPVVVLVAGDGNAPATYLPSDITHTEICAGADVTEPDVHAELEVMTELGWPGRVVSTTDDCLRAAPRGVHRIHPWGDWTLTTGPTGESERDGGWTIPRIEGGRVVAAETWVRSSTERQALTLRHELGHSYGLAVTEDGTDGHDEHATRLMARVPGSSMVGLDRCDGGDFEARP